jgi:hypothetical protein
LQGAGPASGLLGACACPAQTVDAIAIKTNPIPLRIANLSSLF